MNAERALTKQLRRLEIRASRLVDEVFAGQYHSAFKGVGLEFEEVRPYQPGDDVRAMDWKVTARSGIPHIKLFREERELSVYLLIDMSGSQFFGTRGQLKRDLVVDVAALLTFAALRNNDRVGLMCFTDHVEKVVAPGKGLRHALRILRDLSVWQPQRTGTKLSTALEELNKAVKRTSIVFVISDFIGQGYERALRIAARRHDLIALVVRDALETELPRVGLLSTRDPETGHRVLLDTLSRRQRQQYREQAAAEAHLRQERFSRAGIDWATLETGQDPIEPLRKLFSLRAYG